MAVTARPFGLFMKSLLNKELDFDTDSIGAMLCTSAYTPDPSTHQYKSSVTNEVTGTGYTAGGVTLTSPTVVYTAANSWATSRANSTAYTLGQVVRPATGNGFLYQVVVGGTSGGSIPTYPTVVGQTVTDGSVTWVCVGTGVIVADTADASWPTATITARYVVFYDKTPATDATRPLISYGDFGGDIASTGGTFAITLDPLGILAFFV